MRALLAVPTPRDLHNPRRVHLALQLRFVGTPHNLSSTALFARPAPAAKGNVRASSTRRPLVASRSPHALAAPACDLPAAAAIRACYCMLHRQSFPPRPAAPAAIGFIRAFVGTRRPLSRAPSRVPCCPPACDLPAPCAIGFIGVLRRYPPLPRRKGEPASRAPCCPTVGSSGCVMPQRPYPRDLPAPACRDGNRLNPRYVVCERVSFFHDGQSLHYH